MSLKKRFAGVRVISWLAAIGLLLTMLPSLSTTAGAYEELLPLPALTGNKGQDVANIALSQLGYDESWDGGTIFGAWWNTQVEWNYDYTYEGWCAMFACWCANQAGAGMDIAYDVNSASPAHLMDWLQRNAWVDTTFSTNPQPGDFIFFGYGSYAEHIAVVTDYDPTTNGVTFVGGNQSDSVTQWTLDWSTQAYYGDQRIIGYGRPNYGQAVSAPTTPVFSTEREVFFGGTEVTLTWNNVAGAANYKVEIYRDGALYLQDGSVDLSWFTLSQAEAGSYTICVTAQNCAGVSEAASCSFSIIESTPSVPVWVTDSTLAAAQENAKINLYRQDLFVGNQWCYNQISLPDLF